jgi:hypothetical protein
MLSLSLSLSLSIRVGAHHPACRRCCLPFAQTQSTRPRRAEACAWWSPTSSWRSSTACSSARAPRAWPPLLWPGLASGLATRYPLTSRPTGGGRAGDTRPGPRAATALAAAAALRYCREAPQLQLQSFAAARAARAAFLQGRDREPTADDAVLACAKQQQQRALAAQAAGAPPVGVFLLTNDAGLTTRAAANAVPVCSVAQLPVTADQWLHLAAVAVHALSLALRDDPSLAHAAAPPGAGVAVGPVVPSNAEDEFMDIPPETNGLVRAGAIWNRCRCLNHVYLPPRALFVSRVMCLCSKLPTVHRFHGDGPVHPEDVEQAAAEEQRRVERQKMRMAIAAGEMAVDP